MTLIEMMLVWLRGCLGKMYYLYVFLPGFYNFDSNAACAPVVLCGENVIFVVILRGFYDLD